MNNKIKRIGILLMAFVLIFPSTVYAKETTDNQNQGVQALQKRIELMKEEEEQFLASDDVRKNSEANETYQKLAKNLCIDGKYPAFYGGSYINDDNQLVVILTEESEENIQTIRTATEGRDIIIEYGTVSLECLKMLKTKYDEKIQQLVNATNVTGDEKEVLESLVGISLAEDSGTLIVYIHNLDDEKEEAFKAVFGSDNYVRFENSERISMTSSWYTGGKLYVSDKGYLTTGYRAYYINWLGERKNGFVTAGHGCRIGDTVYGVKIGSRVVLGTCLLSSNDGCVDAAFVELTNDDYVVTNTIDPDIANGTILDSIIVPDEDIAIGAIVYSFGAKTGMKVGSVTNNSYLGIHEEVTTGTRICYVDVVQTSLGTQQGDSGGCVCTLGNDGYKVVGTVSFNTDVGFFSKAHNQIDTLGIVKY